MLEAGTPKVATSAVSSGSAVECEPLPTQPPSPSSTRRRIGDRRCATVSEEPIYMDWGNSRVHALACEKDGYNPTVPAEQAASNDPSVFNKYHI